MTRELIEMWEFEKAPAWLQRRHTGVQRPQWLVLIPASIQGPDIDRAIRGQARLGDLCRYRTETGDIIYTGSSLEGGE